MDIIYIHVPLRFLTKLPFHLLTTQVLLVHQNHVDLLGALQICTVDLFHFLQRHNIIIIAEERLYSVLLVQLDGNLADTLVVFRDDQSIWSKRRKLTSHQVLSREPNNLSSSTELS